MATTLTIRNVTDEVAQALRKRAQTHRRSLQRELLLIVERAASEEPSAPIVAEPVPAYSSVRARKASRVRGSAREGRLTLEELWQRARALGSTTPSESAAIVRSDRDARDRR